MRTTNNIYKAQTKLDDMNIRVEFLFDYAKTKGVILGPKDHQKFTRKMVGILTEMAKGYVHISTIEKAENAVVALYQQYMEKLSPRQTEPMDTKSSPRQPATMKPKPIQHVEVVNAQKIKANRSKESKALMDYATLRAKISGRKDQPERIAGLMELTDQLVVVREERQTAVRVDHLITGHVRLYRNP